jgi:hypothetical protein
VAADITGTRYGKLVALAESGRSLHNKAVWAFMCDCGTRTEKLRNDVVSGKTTSCGCSRKEGLTTHGLTGHPLFKTWCQVYYRCKDPKHASYKNYGGRGVKLADEWGTAETFIAGVLADIGKRPEDTTLDRIENNKGYEPGNIRWATKTEQNRNRRNTVKKDEVTLKEAAEKNNIAYATAYNRVKKLGWSFERAVSQPIQTRKQK